MRLKSTFRQTLLGVLVLGVSCPFVSAGGASSESVLVFQVRWGVADQTGLALANPTDRVANVELFLIQNNGTFRGLAEVVIAAGEQQAKVLTDFFPTATNINGFIVAFSDNIGVVGFFLTFAPDISQIDGAEASLAIILSRAVIFPELLTGQGESTELNVIVFASSDPAPRNFTLEFDLCGADGACRREVRLLPSGPVGVARFSTTVAELFGGPGPAGEAVFDQSYVTVNVPNGLTIGYQEFRGENFRGGRNALSLLAGSSRPFSLFAAQVADTPDITSDITRDDPEGTNSSYHGTHCRRYDRRRTVTNNNPEDDPGDGRSASTVETMWSMLSPITSFRCGTSTTSLFRRPGKSRPAAPLSLWPGDDPEGTNSSYHGTHVAGTIGAVTNNNLGVAGVNQVSPLMIVRTQGAEGVGTEFEIYNGLLFAVGLPNVLGEQPAGDFVAARVVNMSLGGTGIGPFGRQAVEDALGTGAIIVSSAGNSNSDAPHFPSDLPGVIEVGATDVLGDKTPYSNFGNNDIAAPGGNLAADINGDNRPDGVISTLWNQVQETPTYQFYQGTSMASAHVSGIVSLMLSANPDLTREQVMIILGLTSTVPAGAAQSPTGGLDPFYGVGIINAFQAVATAADVETGPRMVWTPGTLDFGVLHDELQARVFNLGSGDLSVEEPVVETTSGGSWLSAELEGEDLTVRVDRTGLADGRYEGTIQLMSNGGDGALDIGMQVGIDESSDIGDVFVLAIDPRTLNAEGQSEPARVSDGYQYEIYPFPAGEYLILAGTDRDDDGFICDEGEFCGSFPVSSQPLPVKVEAGLDTSGIDFTVAVEEEITPSSAAGRRGYRVRSTPALRKLLQRLRANGPAAWEAQSESDASGKTGEGK